MPRKTNPALKRNRNERRFFMVEKTEETTALMTYIRETLIPEPGAMVADAGILREGLYALALYLILKNQILSPIDRNRVLGELRKVNYNDRT